MSGRGNYIKMFMRDGRRNLLSYLSMIIITMLAVTLLCGFIFNSITLKKRVNSFFDQSNLTDLVVQFSQIKSEDGQFFDALKSDGSITKYEYRLQCDGGVGGLNGKLYIGSNTISAPIICGGGPGVLIPAGRGRIGEVLDVQVLGYSLIFTVTGYMYFAECCNGTSLPLYIDGDVFVTEMQTRYGVAMPLSALYNQVLVKTDNIDSAAKKINAHYGGGQASNFLLCYSRDSIESVVALNGEVNTSLKMIYVFPVIFLLVSVLVILTTVSALILRERTNIGTLKALGISNKKILLLYAFFGAALCFAGGMIGGAISPFVVPKVMQIKYNLIYSLPAYSGVSFNLFYLAAAVLFVSLLALLIGIAVCRGVIRQNPSQCMRPPQIKENFLLKATAITKNSRKNKSGGKGEKIRLPFLMAVRNIAVKPWRALMTVAGVLGCVALLVCAFGIGDTVNNSIALELGGQFSYDIRTMYTAQAKDEFLPYMDTLVAEGKADDYETYKTYYLSVKSGNAVKSLSIYSIASDSHFTTINPQGGALISASIAKEMGIKSDQTVVISGSDTVYELKISGIIQTAVTKGIFIDHDIFDGEYCQNGMWIKAENADELIPLIKEASGSGDAMSMHERQETVRKAVSSISSIKLTMMFFSLALSVVVLFNLSLLNVKERSRSIATLKVLGFSNFEVSLSLFFEVMLLVLLGTLIGLSLGFPFLRLVLGINKIELIAFIYRITPLSYVLSAALSVITAAGINLIFGAVIRKIKMLDSLKSVE